MKNLRKKLSLAILGLLMANTTGCLREDTSGCSTSFMFTVRAYDTDKVTELPSAVEDVVLYIFDENDLFVEEIATTTGTTITSFVPGSDLIRIVAWGNLGGGNQTRPVLKAGDHISTAAVELLALAPAGKIYRSPDDIFMGSATLARDYSAMQIIPIYRKTGKLGITIIGLKNYFGITGDNISVIVNSTCRSIPFLGSSPKGEVSYQATGEFNAAGQFIVEPFNVFAASGKTIEIFHSNDLLASASTTDGTNPIDVQESITTNVLITYYAPGSVQVNIILTPWGEYKLWKEL